MSRGNLRRYRKILPSLVDIVTPASITPHFTKKITTRSRHPASDRQLPGATPQAERVECGACRLCVAYQTPDTAVRER